MTAAEQVEISESTTIEASPADRKRGNVALSCGLLIVATWLAAALTASSWRRFDPVTDQNLADRLAAPSAEHLLGTDALGRDVFARVVDGARISIPLALAAVAVALLAGGAVGLISLVAPRRVTWLLDRLVDVSLSFPPIVLALLAAAALGAGPRNVVIAIALVGWPEYARLSRAQFLAVRSRDHVLAARILGCGRVRVFSKHVLPFAAGPILVRAAHDLSSVVLAIAFLSFLGLGVVPPQPEWGSMINEGRTNIEQWWLTVFPGIAISSVAIAFSLVGDGLRDRLDPRTS